MLQDLRYAFRMLAKSPGFSIIAILTLALGIGANTAIFSVVNGVLINPLPFHHPEQLVSLFQQMHNFSNASISYPNFVDWRRMNTTFSGMAAYRTTEFTLTGNGEPERLRGEMISAGFFEILGVNPAVGRNFTADDDRLGAEPTCMITEGLWKRKFGGRSDIIGQRIILNEVGRTVVGVVPSSFHLSIQNFQRGGPPNQVYTPVGEYNEPRFYNARGSGWGMDAIGRLKPGVTLEQARSDMDRVSRDLALAYPEIDSDKKATILSLREEMVGRVQPVLLFLLGAVVLVLMIACVNVANLLLARSTVRRQEFAIRIALGAGYRRVVRQLLTESVLLALAGGALGLLLARLGTTAAVAAVPRNMPRADEISLDPRVLFFTLLISLLAGIIFGLAPAWRLARSTVGVLGESSHRVAGTRSRTQAVFVVGEMAMALVLLIAAGLMVRSLTLLWHLDPGFNPHNVLTFELSGPDSLKQQSADAIRSAYRQIHDKLASVPGVEAVSYNWGAHPMGSDSESYFAIVGRPRPAHQSDFPMAIEYDVEPDYFKVMQIQLKRGRLFTTADNEHTQAVIVIDETLAQKYFPNGDPIGQYIDLNTSSEDIEKLPTMQIVGIVAHVNQWGLASDGASGALHAQIYLPFTQIPDSIVKRVGVGAEVFARLNAPASAVLPALRSRVLEVNGALVVHSSEAMEKTVADSVAGQRFSMSLLGIFAALALALAAIGIYGVLSYMVSQRTREIGVRMALGAQQLDVLRLVMKDGAQMTLVGLLIGLAAALVLTRLMRSMLFGVQPTDPLTFLVVAALLGVIALLACYIPAQRAMKVNPIEALRQE